MYVDACIVLPSPAPLLFQQPEQSILASSQGCARGDPPYPLNRSALIARLWSKTMFWSPFSTVIGVCFSATSNRARSVSCFDRSVLADCLE